MARIPDIIVCNGHGLGEYCDVKRIPNPGETCTAYNRRFEIDAGKGTNTACAIGRLGGNVAFIGKCGVDQASELGYKWMGESNVDTTHYWLDPSIESCMGLCIIAKNGENMLLDFDNDSYSVQADEVDRCMRKMSGAKFVTSGFAQDINAGLQACKTGKALGMTTLLNPSPLRVGIALEELSYVDFLVVNEGESYELLDKDPEEDIGWEALGRLLQGKYKFKNVIITLGSKGSAAVTQDSVFMCPSTKVEMVDETGAGDGFLGAVAYCLSKGKSLKEAMEWSNVYAAYTVTKKGSLEHYPWKQSIPEIFKNLGKEDLLF